MHSVNGLDGRKMTDPEKVPAIPFYKLVGSGIDLASAFKSAVDAFNARDLTTLMNLCDEGVVVSRPRSRYSQNER